MAKPSKHKHAQTVASPPTAQIKVINKFIKRGDVDLARERLEFLFDKYPAYPPC